MSKKKLDYLNEKLSLEFWIFTILVIMMIGSIIIISHINNRFSNLVTFIGSLIGGLITLISVSLTNRYYNQQKIIQNREDKKEEIKRKLNALKFLKKEINDNEVKYNSRMIGYKFQSVIWEEFRREFIEIFINYPEKELSDLQDFYKIIMEQDNNISSYKLENITINLTFCIKEYIDKALNDYQIKYDNLI